MNFKPVNIENLALLSGEKIITGVVRTECGEGVLMVARFGASDASNVELKRRIIHENIISNFIAACNSIFIYFSPVYTPQKSLIANPFARGSRSSEKSRFSISFPIPRDAVRSEIGSNGRPQRVANRNRIAGAINGENGKQTKAVGHILEALNSIGALFGRSPDNLGRAGRTGRDTRQILKRFAGACRE